MLSNIDTTIDNLLELDNSKDSFILGYVDLWNEEDMVIKIMQNYYNHIKKIEKVFKKESDELSIFEIDRTLYFDAYKLISKHFFPTYQHFQNIYSSERFYNSDFDECKIYPKSESDRKYFVSQISCTKENYIKFVFHNCPSKIKAKLVKQVAIKFEFEDLNSHSLIVGKTGYGKSVLILELIDNIIKQQNCSIVLMEPHGDLSNQVCKIVPEDDLLLIDPFLQDGFLPCVNIFEINDTSIKNISIYTNIIIDVFKQIIGSEFSPSMQSLLTPMIAVLLEIKDTSFYDMLKFLDEKQNKELLSYGQNLTQNPTHREYFKTGFTERRLSSTKYSIYTKLQVLIQDPIFANLLNGKSSINLEKALNTKGKVIIFKLNSLKMKETVKPVGKFLTALLVFYIFKRESIPIEKRVRSHFFLDEAAVFLTPKTTMTILDQSRKFNLSMHSAIQHNAQLDPDVNASMLSNTGIKFVTINSNKNNRIIAPELRVKVDELDNLKNKGEFFIKIGTKEAIKLKITDRLVNNSSSTLSKELYSKLLNSQLEKYYKKINYEKISYAPIPKVEKSKKEIKPYSKKSTEDLLSKIDNEVDDELLDY